MNLKEIMVKGDKIQEDLQCLVNMNQGSQANENPAAVAHPMEEESVVSAKAPRQHLMVLIVHVFLFVP